MQDFTWKGKKGYYWIYFDKHQNGGIRAQALGPIQPTGVAQSIGPVAAKRADTTEEAKRVLMAELQRIDA